MSKRAGKGQRPWDNPKAYALSVVGMLVLVLGLTVADSVLLALLGFALTLAGWLVARRTSGNR